MVRILIEVYRLENPFVYILLIAADLTKPVRVYELRHTYPHEHENTITFIVTIPTQYDHFIMVHMIWCAGLDSAAAAIPTAVPPVHDRQ